MNKVEAKQQHEEELQKNDLAEWGRSFWTRLRAGEVIGKRFMLLALAVVAAVALWMYISRGAKSGDIAQWNTLEGISGVEKLDEFAKDAKDSKAGKVAQLRKARILLGQQGLPMLSAPGAQDKAVKAIEEARDLFKKLSDDFKNDVALQGQCFDGAAHAELALVGIPKEGTAATAADWRGSVDEAVKWLEKLGALGDAENPACKAALAKAKLLKEKKDEVAKVQGYLWTQMTRKLGDEPKSPDSLNPKAATPTPSIAVPALPAPVIPEAKK